MAKAPSTTSKSPLPALPRRAVLASVLSAVVAGAAGGLVWLGDRALAQTDTFTFSRGTTFGQGEETRLRGFLSQAALNPRLDVLIVGHTGDQGDEEANLALSQARAELARDVALDLGIAIERLSWSGVGGGAPLAQEDGQTSRAHQSAMARVELSLQVQR